MDSSMFDQAVIAWISVWLIQKAKDSPSFPLIQAGAKTAIRGFSALVAMLSASGILVAYNWNGPSGDFSLAITGLTVGNAMLFLWMTAKSFVAQEVLHKLLKAATVAAVR